MNVGKSFLVCPHFLFGMMKMKSGIYIILNTETKDRYVGQAANLDKRFKEHIKTLKGNYHCNAYLQRSFNKYGLQSFIFNVIEYCDVDCLTAQEQFWIDQLQPEYNAAPVAGSMLNYKHTDEARANMSKAHIGKKQHSEEHKRKLSERMKGNKINVGRKQTAQIEAMRLATKGKPKSAEHKAKIAASNRGKFVSDETRKKQSEAAKRRRIREKRIDSNLKICIDLSNPSVPGS